MTVVCLCCRYFLHDKDYNSGIYFGRHFKPYVKNGYMSGGAGYVLSREALKVSAAYGRETKCDLPPSSEIWTL